MKKKQYILDTNIVIEFIHANSSVTNHLRAAGIKNCAISVLSLEELYFGAYNAPLRYREQELAHVRALRQKFPIIAVPEDADDFGRIKANLVKRGLIIDDFDIPIAATAIKENMTVVTDNIKHFARIEGLIIENWVNP